ncbi:MAG: MBL fold metallo-hydrolase [Chloroflexi bacterium]|nr:MBL fold metallo-hydrolase [Chloroflexota bacterium]
MLDVDGVEIDRFSESCVRIRGSRLIFIDPFNLEGFHDGSCDLALISHGHPGHFSAPDLRRVIGPRTVVIANPALETELETWPGIDLNILRAGDSLRFGPVLVRAVAAYSTEAVSREDLPLHPREAGGLGFVVELDGLRIYHAGDTGLIAEMSELGEIDVAMLPVAGGTVMTADEAAEAVRRIDPRIVVPVHYGVSWGTVDDAYRLADISDRRVEIV